MSEKTFKVNKFSKGVGISYFHRKKVFIPLSFKGEVVKGELITDYKKQHLIIHEILEKKYNRIKPKCNYFFECGGCLYQNISYGDEISMKKELYLDELKKEFSNINLEKIDINFSKSINEYFYRNRIDLLIKNGSFGFRKQFSYDSFIEIEKCVISSNLINKVVKELNKIPKKYLKFLDNFEINSYFVIRSSNKQNLLVFSVPYNVKDRNENELNELVNIILKLDIDNFLINYVDSTSDISIDFEGFVELKKGNSFLTQEVVYEGEKLNYNVPWSSFFQINSNMLEVFLEKSIGLLKNETSPIIYDLFSGSGFLTLALSKIFDKVYGFEFDSNAINLANENAKKNKINNVKFIQCDLYNKESIKDIISISPRLDIVVIDPPRSGINRSTIRLLYNLNPKKILYISCNYKSQISDIKRLNKYFKDKGSKKIFNIDKINLIDMFAKTTHFESVCLLNSNHENLNGGDLLE